MDKKFQRKIIREVKSSYKKKCDSYFICSINDYTPLQIYEFVKKWLDKKNIKHYIKPVNIIGFYLGEPMPTCIDVIFER